MPRLVQHLPIRDPKSFTNNLPLERPDEFDSFEKSNQLAINHRRDKIVEVNKQDHPITRIVLDDSNEILRYLRSQGNGVESAEIECQENLKEEIEKLVKTESQSSKKQGAGSENDAIYREKL
jgi:hypothetical protein